MIRGSGPWVGAIQALAGSIIATLAVFWAGVTTLTITSEFPPLASPGPTIVFTTMGALGAIGVFAVLRRLTERPVQLFRRIAVVVLLFSFLPDLWLLSEGAAMAFPGASPAAVAVLMVMHVVAATVIVWFLTVKGRPREEHSEPREDPSLARDDVT